MSDHHQKSTDEASAQDIAEIALIALPEQSMNCNDEAATSGDGLSVHERLKLEDFYGKRSTPNYQPVQTKAHGLPYTTHLATAAKSWATSGFFVLPCRPLDILDGKGEVLKGAKAPLTKNGCYDATIEPNQIEKWWSQQRFPDALIGVRTGAMGSIWVLDIDTKHADGFAELKKLEAKFGPLPETYTVITPSGGKHFYFKMPDIDLGCSAGRVAPSIDVRANGGYVIVPPSMMSDGRAYEALDNGFTANDAAWAPQWLIDLAVHGGSEKAFAKIASRGWAYKILARKAEDVAKAEEGSRNETLNKAAFAVGVLVGQQALDRSAAFDALMEAAKKCGLDAEEAKKTINSGLSAGAEEKGDAPPFPDWSKHGPIRDSIDNVRALLSFLGIGLKNNIFTQRAEMSGFKSYSLLNDNAWAELWSVAHTFAFQPSKKFLADALEAIALENQFHPVRDYYDGLQWDGVKRLDKWLITYAGADDNAYVEAVGAKTLIAAVRRIYRPGTKFDTMPVIEGIQGSGKSSMLRILAVHDEWFADGLSLTDKTREVMEQVEGCLIVEIQELKGMRHNEVENTKALLSKTHDKARKAYGRFTTNLPRQFVLFATTNPGDKASYLKDQTGNRRFWPIKTGDEIDLVSLKRDRDQLWAEAVHRERQGESLVLPRRLWDVAKAEQDKRVAEHPWVAALDDFFGDALGRVAVEDVWALLGKREPSRRSTYDMNDLGAAMKKLGWEHTRLRKDGVRRYFYVRGAEPYPDLSVALAHGEKPVLICAGGPARTIDNKPVEY